MFSISLVVYEVIQFENFICAIKQINRKWMSNWQAYDTNANAVDSSNTFLGKEKNAKKYWFNKFQRRGKNTIHLLPPFDQICKVDERDIHLQRREKYFRSTLTFCYFISLKIGPLEIVHPVNTRNIYRRSFALRNNTLTDESISAELFTIIVQSFCNFERICILKSKIHVGCNFR